MFFLITATTSMFSVFFPSNFFLEGLFYIYIFLGGSYKVVFKMK